MRAMTHTPFALLMIGSALWGASLAATAQQRQQQLTPQQRYEQQLAYCNSGKLPEPARNACVRDAGNMLDRADGPPRDVTSTSQDGRATIVSPAGLPTPNSGSDDVRSKDGRSTIVLPADQNK
jgi:hypothetical protein